MTSPVKKQNPIPPRSIVRLKKLWPHARKRHYVGEIRIIGYFSRLCGLDCVWLVDTAGNYDWTSDHEWLYRHFEVVEFSHEQDLFGEETERIEPLDEKSIERFKTQPALHCQ